MTRTELAAALGISVSMVSRLVKRGMPDDSIDRAQRWRKKHLQIGRVKGIKHGTDNTAPGAPVEPDDENVAMFTDSRARKEHYQAELAKLELGKQQGDLLEAGPVLFAVSSACTEIRTSLEAFADRLAPELAHIADENLIKTKMNGEVQALLVNLSHKFEKIGKA